MIKFLGFLWNNKKLLWVEAKQFLYMLGVILFQCISMHIVRALLLRAKSNCCRDLDHRRLILHLFRLLDSSFHGLEIIVTLLHPLHMPAVCFEAFRDILSERNSGVSIYVTLGMQILFK